jgi:hypothetical protein
VGGDLTPDQGAALRTLAPVLGDDFYLGGGVAVSLRLHHRTSHDLDLFTSDVDPVSLEERVAQLTGVHVSSRAPGTLHLEVGGVPVSLLRYRYPLLEPPERSAAVPVRLASLDDLICMKLSAIAGRGARRDFWDLHRMLGARGVSLEAALQLFARKFASTDRGHVVRALVYFADADHEPMPAQLTEASWGEIKRDFQAWVLALPRA